MEILILLIPLSVLLALAIGALFWWSAESGQFDDLEGPGNRILMDNDRPPAPIDATFKTARANQPVHSPAESHDVAS